MAVEIGTLKQLLHGADVVSGPKEVRGERVPEGTGSQPSEQNQALRVAARALQIALELEPVFEQREIG